MRIAVTGTHGSGKTTLIEDFLDAQQFYAHEQEPYWSLVQQGVVFADGPTVDDLEEQLGWSARMIRARAGEADVIFDRCPLDFIAYLDVVSARQGFEWEPTGKLLAAIEKAVAALELIVFLPLAVPDEITVSIELPKLRAAVDRRLKTLLRDDPLGLFSDGGPRVIELNGSRKERLAALERAAL